MPDAKTSTGSKRAAVGGSSRSAKKKSAAKKSRASAAKKGSAKKASAKKQAKKKSVTKKASQARKTSKKATTKKSAAKKGASKAAKKPTQSSLVTPVPTATSAVHKAALGKKKPRPKLEIGPDELEFIRAIDEYKAVHHVAFPSCSELLYVLKKLGYKR